MGLKEVVKSIDTIQKEYVALSDNYVALETTVNGFYKWLQLNTPFDNAKFERKHIREKFLECFSEILVTEPIGEKKE
jgi:hypothetical protein